MLLRSQQQSDHHHLLHQPPTIRAPEIDISELESLFSVTMPNMEAKRQRQHPSVATKQEKVHLIDLQRSKNCEIMLRNIKMPLPDLMGSVLALDDSIVDGDQVDYLIKFCPTKEEMELLKGYTGKKENLGNCEQVADLKNSLSTINSVAEEVLSDKLPEVLDFNRDLAHLEPASKVAYI
nr:unnamed protein product [Digitaria exilis]